MMQIRRVILGVSGASGALLGFRIAHILKEESKVELHIIVSRAAEQTLKQEVGEHALQQIKQCADVVHAPENVGASIASGSFQHYGMIVAPCSMRTLSAVAYSLADNLLTRAADVTLKERRRLVLMTRETPLHLGHIKAMTAVTEMGGIIMPPVPAFYNGPQTIEDLVDGIARRAISLLGEGFCTPGKEWMG